MSNEEMKKFEEGFKKYSIPQWIIEEEKEMQKEVKEENIIPAYSISVRW